MEAERRLLRRRKPLYDLTNTNSHTRPSSHSSSSTASVVKPPKPYPSSPFNNPAVSSCKSGARTLSSNISTNYRDASNPSPLPPAVSTPSRPLNSSSLPDKRNSNDSSKPGFLPPSIVSTPSQPRKTSSVSVAGSRDHDVFEPIPIVYSRRHTSDKRKGKEKAVAIPFSSTPMLKISSNREKNDEVEGVNLPKAKALTAPCRKKRCTMASKEDVFQHALPQDFIKKQQAYFKEIDNFELAVEEVESVDELD